MIVRMVISVMCLVVAGWTWAQDTTSSVLRSDGGVSVLGRVKPEKSATTNAPRESIITAKRVDYDNKEGVIVFDEDVVVDNEQFVLKSDRLFVFMQGTNDVDRILADGNVSITNLNRAATCDKAVFTKKDGQIVMTGRATLMTGGERAGIVTGDKIVIWIDDERMEVSPGRVTLPPGTFNSNKNGKTFLP